MSSWWIIFSEIGRCFLFCLLRSLATLCFCTTSLHCRFQSLTPPLSPLPPSYSLPCSAAHSDSSDSILSSAFFPYIEVNKALSLTLPTFQYTEIHVHVHMLFTYVFSSMKSQENASPCPKAFHATLLWWWCEKEEKQKRGNITMTTSKMQATKELISLAHAC